MPATTVTSPTSEVTGETMLTTLYSAVDDHGAVPRPRRRADMHPSGVRSRPARRLQPEDTVFTHIYGFG